MSSQVFLAPCDPGNFKRTVLSDVALSDYSDRPEPLAAKDTARFWGARVGSDNQTYFEMMEPRDLVLFYQNNRYIGTGRIGMCFEDDENWISNTFWRGAPSQLIYTIEDFTHVSVPKKAANRLFGYVEDYYPQGLMRVKPSKVEPSIDAIELAMKKYADKQS